MSVGNRKVRRTSTPGLDQNRGDLERGGVASPCAVLSRGREKQLRTQICEGLCVYDLMGPCDAQKRKKRRPLSRFAANPLRALHAPPTLDDSWRRASGEEAVSENGSRSDARRVTGIQRRLKKEVRTAGRVEGGGGRGKTWQESTKSSSARDAGQRGARGGEGVIRREHAAQNSLPPIGFTYLQAGLASSLRASSRFKPSRGPRSVGPGNWGPEGDPK